MNTITPKVSIVLPTYNGSKYLRQSIDSCLSQTYKDLELIVVDDCSTDTTPDIIKSYVDKRIKYIRNEKNQRLPRSLNIGFAKAKGDYLTWTSDDNIYAPQAIEKMLRFLINQHYDFVFSDYYTINDDSVDQPTLVQLPRVVSFEKINPIRASFLYTRHVNDVTGDYDPDMELVEDYEYWIRVSRRFVMHHYPEPLYYYRVHQAQLYLSKYWEVEVIKFLVRLKYDISDIHQITQQYVDLIVQKRRLFIRFNRTLTRILFFKKIYRVLNNFKSNYIDFKTAKSELNSLIDNHLVNILMLSLRDLLMEKHDRKYAKTGVS